MQKDPVMAHLVQEPDRIQPCHRIQWREIRLQEEGAAVVMVTEAINKKDRITRGKITDDKPI